MRATVTTHASTVIGGAELFDVTRGSGARVVHLELVKNEFRNQMAEVILAAKEARVDAAAISSHIRAAYGPKRYRRRRLCPKQRARLPRRALSR